MPGSDGGQETQRQRVEPRRRNGREGIAKKAKAIHRSSGSRPSPRPSPVAAGWVDGIDCRGSGRKIVTVDQRWMPGTEATSSELTPVDQRG